MITKCGMTPVHPGEVLREELHGIGVSATGLAKAMGVSANRVTAILNGDRDITGDTACVSPATSTLRHSSGSTSSRRGRFVVQRSERVHASANAQSLGETERLQ